MRNSFAQDWLGRRHGNELQTTGDQWNKAARCSNPAVVVEAVFDLFYL